MVPSSLERINDCFRLLDTRERVVWGLLLVTFLPLVLARTIQNSLTSDGRLIWLFLGAMVTFFFAGWGSRCGSGLRPDTKRFYILFTLGALCSIAAALTSSLSLGVISAGFLLASFSMRACLRDTWIYSFTIITAFVFLSLTPSSLQRISRVSSRFGAQLSSRILDGIDVANIVFDDLVVTDVKQIDVSGLTRGLEIEIIAASVIFGFLILRCRSFVVTVSSMVALPALIFFLKTGIVLVVIWRGTAPTYFSTSFFGLYHALAVLAYVAIAVAVVNVIRIVLFVVPPPRIEGDSLLSIEAFNVLLRWPNSVDTSREALERNVTTASVDSDVSRAKGIPSLSTPLIICACISACCGIAVLTMWLIRKDERPSKTLGEAQTRVATVLEQTGVVGQQPQPQSFAESATIDFLIGNAEPQNIFGLGRFTSEYDFLNDYSRQHQAILVRNQTIKEAYSSPGAVGSNAGDASASHGFMVPGSYPCRSLFSVVVDSELSTVRARGDVRRIPTWSDFLMEWIVDKGSGPTGYVFYLAQDSSWPLSEQENHDARDRLTKLVLAILEARE
jgi:hypothetical protein